MLDIRVGKEQIQKIILLPVICNGIDPREDIKHYLYGIYYLKDLCHKLVQHSRNDLIDHIGKSLERREAHIAQQRFQYVVEYPREDLVKKPTKEINDRLEDGIVNCLEYAAE